MALTSFADLQQLLTGFVNNHNIDITRSPHGEFWNTSYNNFIKGTVPDENGNPIPILNKINDKYDGPSSNLVMALAGDAPLFTKNDPNAPIGQMPYNGPYLPSDQIQDISDWITAQCPE